MTPEPGGSVNPDYVNLVEADIPGFRKALDGNPGVHPFDLEDMMSGSPESAERIRLHGYPAAQERRDFGPRQVRTIEQIKPGHRYWLATVLEDGNEKGRIGLIITKSEPYQDEDGNWWVNCDGYRRYGDTSRRLDKVSLADLSITPRSDTMWANWNWLEFHGTTPKR